MPPADRHPGGLQPRRQGRVHDPQIGGDRRHRRALRRPVQLYRVPPELLRVHLPHHERIISLPPGSAWVQRVHQTGSGPDYDPALNQADVLRIDDRTLNADRLWPEGWTICPEANDPTRGKLVWGVS